jgi:MoaA/NifB/PqqE/SkfB family radical SAM enzyme
MLIRGQNNYNIKGVVRWFITDICNYNCSYCFACRSSKYKAENVYLYLEAIKNKIHKDWAFNILGGGEPFTHPEFFPIIEGLIKLRYRISINSNFSASINDLERFIELTKGKLDFFDASLHLEHTDVNEFLNKIIYLRQKYPYFRNYLVLTVAVKEYLDKLEGIKRLFSKHNIEFFAQHHRIGSNNYNYTKKEEAVIEKINKEVDNKSGPYRSDSIKKYCKSGRNNFTLLPTGWAISCVPLENNMGNILDGSFKLSEEQKTCPLENCYCWDAYIQYIDRLNIFNKRE